MKFIASIFFLGLLISCTKPDCSDDLPACSLEPESGPCEALIPKYYYDKKSKSCKEFDWGGCGGVVPFDSKEDCEACLCYKVN